MKSERVIGFVIEGEQGFFLSAGNAWREVSVSAAHVHDSNEIEKIREAFHRKRNKPQKMYDAVREENITTLLTGIPIAFYVSPGSSTVPNRKFVGDCYQLTI